MHLIDNVPHLTTANSGPLSQLERLLLEKQCAIECWLRAQWKLTPPNLYSSVDLRNAGVKLAPVDTNLFSAGFNNLNPEFLALCVQAAQATISQQFPNCQRILLIPENHTRNQFYFKSLYVLYEILQKSGYEVRIGSLRSDLTAPETIIIEEDKQMIIEPIIRSNDRLYVENFSPCLIVLNHDLSEGMPDILKNLKQTITPPLALGWASRLKSTHFQHYNDVCNELAELIAIDPWLINPLFRSSQAVDFMTGEGEVHLTEQVGQLLADIDKKYAEYHIQEKPYVVVKADAGTYGMGIMIVHDADELKQMNRKQRTNMAKTKGSQKITRVIMQEGVYTLETRGEQKATAEPVIYMIGQYVVGGFYRVHSQRASNENLNSPGMHFEHLAFASTCNMPDKLHHDSCQNRFYAYGVIARLAGLAAARELAAIKKGI